MDYDNDKLNGGQEISGGSPIDGGQADAPATSFEETGIPPVVTDIPPVLETYSLEQSEASGDGAEAAADGKEAEAAAEPENTAEHGACEGGSAGENQVCGGEAENSRPEAVKDAESAVAGAQPGAFGQGMQAGTFDNQNGSQGADGQRADGQGAQSGRPGGYAGYGQGVPGGQPGGYGGTGVHRR